MTPLDLCRKVAEVWGWEIGAIKYRGKSNLCLTDSHVYPATWCRGDVIGLARYLADRVEAETDPKIIERLCELWWEWKGRKPIGHYSHNCLPVCRFNAADLARILRDAGKKTTISDSVCEALLDGARVTRTQAMNRVAKCERDPNQRVRFKDLHKAIARALADHEAKCHRCEKCKERR